MATEAARLKRKEPTHGRTWTGGALFLAFRLKRSNVRMIPLRQINAEIEIQIFRVAVDENEGVVKAQNSRGVVFAPRSCQSRAEDRSSETLPVNQLSANRSTTLTNLGCGAESRVLQKSGPVSNRPEM